MKVPVEEYRQKETWSCGPAALKILLSRFGHHLSEDRLIQLSGAGPEGGATHVGLVRAVQSLGLRVFSSSNASVADLKSYIERGIPVLVDFQGKRGGHFAVVYGYRNGRLDIQDPHETGETNYSLDEAVFDARWHSTTYPDKEFVERWFMVVLS